MIRREQKEHHDDSHRSGRRGTAGGGKRPTVTHSMEPDIGPDGGPQFHDAIEQFRQDRSESVRALQVVEYALSAPAPRRQRTWLHRVTTAVDALARSLDRQVDGDASLGLLAEIALSHPDYATQIHRLRQEQRDLRIAVASIREQIEDHPELPIDTSDVRDRLATIAHRYRQHRAREADLIYLATAIDVADEPPTDP